MKPNVTAVQGRLNRATKIQTTTQKKYYQKKLTVEKNTSEMNVRMSG